MRNVAIFFCMTPWFVLAIAEFLSHFGSTVPQIDGTVGIAGVMWMIMSPVVMGIAIGIAYREGQYSERKKK